MFIVETSLLFFVKIKVHKKCFWWQKARTLKSFYWFLSLTICPYVLSFLFKSLFSVLPYTLFIVKVITAQWASCMHILAATISIKNSLLCSKVVIEHLMWTLHVIFSYWRLLHCFLKTIFIIYWLQFYSSWLAKLTLFISIGNDFLSANSATNSIIFFFCTVEIRYKWLKTVL